MADYSTIQFTKKDLEEYQQLRDKWVEQHKVDISMAKMIRIFAEAYKAGKV